MILHLRHRLQLLHCWSLLPETFCLFYCEHELLFQLLVALIRREIQTIKAAWEYSTVYKFNKVHLKVMLFM